MDYLHFIVIALDIDELNHSNYSLASNCRGIEIVGEGAVAEFVRN